MVDRRWILWMGGMCVASCAGMSLGCARWNHERQEELGLPLTQMSPDSVVLEVTVLRVDPERQGEFAEIWRQIDEQQLPVSLRRALAENGFRSGVLGPQLPPLIRTLLQTPTDVTEHVGGEEDVVLDVTARSNRYQARAGRARKIPCTSVRESLLALVSDSGVIRGQTYAKGQGLLTVKPFPKGNGGARLEITPEVEFGEPKSRRIGQEGAWQLNVARDCRVFEQLRMEVHLAPGQTFLLTTIPEAKGLGREFLTADSASGRELRVVLIRLAQTQYDNLFAPDEIVEPLVTPGD